MEILRTARGSGLRGPRARPGERPAERLAHAIGGDRATLVEAIEAFVARHAPAERALVFIDQLEELFTMAAADERQRFIEVLEALRANPLCCFVLALRADFFGALMDSALWARASPSRLEVALRGKALAEAITALAMWVDVHVEARLCDRLVTGAAAEPGVLPLMQETLRMLWDKRRHRYLGLDAYEALGQGRTGPGQIIVLSSALVTLQADARSTPPFPHRTSRTRRSTSIDLFGRSGPGRFRDRACMNLPGSFA